MKIIYKLALALLLAMPAVVNAGGIGLYVPISFGDTMDVTLSPDSGYTGASDVNQVTEYKAATGLGLMFDSNLGKDKLFNYRLGLEWMDRTVDTVSYDGGSARSCTGDSSDLFRFQMIHTFGFGVLRTEMFRLWIGPRINLGWNYRNDEGTYGKQSEFNYEIGIAPVVGLNVNIGRWFAVAADLDYRFAGVGGAYVYSPNTGSDRTNTYSGSDNGATMRLYAIFKFGEDFRPDSQYEDEEPQQSLDSSDESANY